MVPPTLMTKFFIFRKHEGEQCDKMATLSECVCVCKKLSHHRRTDRFPVSTQE